MIRLLTLVACVQIFHAPCFKFLHKLSWAALELCEVGVERPVDPRSPATNGMGNCSLGPLHKFCLYH